MAITYKQLQEAILDSQGVSCLPEDEKAKCRLIWRYRDKVSPRLLTEQKALISKGRKLWSNMIHKIIMTPNPFLARITRGASD